MLSMQGLSLICLIYMPKVSEKKTNVMFENIYLALLCKTFHKLLFPVYIQCTHDYANKTLILNCKMASRLLCTQNACTKRCWVMLLNRDVAPPYRSLEILPCLWNVSSLLNNHTRLPHFKAIGLYLISCTILLNTISMWFLTRSPIFLRKNTQFFHAASMRYLPSVSKINISMHT